MRQKEEREWEDGLQLKEVLSWLNKKNGKSLIRQDVQAVSL